MRIREWMTKEVIYVNVTTSMLKATKLMNIHMIRRLPVVDDSMRIVGIVSDRDIKDASPSKATTLDIHELQYLLSEIKIQDIMTPNPVTVSPDDSIESVAMLMEAKAYGSLPVVDKDNLLVGIISEHDIYKVLIEITGVRLGALQLVFALQDEPGALCSIFNAFCEHRANVISILTDHKSVEGKGILVYIRLYPMLAEQEKSLIAICREKLGLVACVNATDESDDHEATVNRDGSI